MCVGLSDRLTAMDIRENDGLEAALKWIREYCTIDKGDWMLLNEVRSHLYGIRALASAVMDQGESADLHALMPVLQREADAAVGIIDGIEMAAAKAVNGTESNH